MKENLFTLTLNLLYLKAVIAFKDIQIFCLKRKIEIVLFITSPRYRTITLISLKAYRMVFKIKRRQFIKNKIIPFFLGKEEEVFEPTDAQLVYHSHSGPIRLKGYVRVNHHARFPTLTRKVTLTHLYKALDPHPDINEGVFSMLKGDATAVFQDLVRKTQFVRNWNEMVAEINERNSKRKTTGAV